MVAGLGVCVGERNAPIRSDAWLRMPAEPTASHNCGPDVKRRMYWCHAPVVNGTWLPAVHGQCVHNERASLLLRTLGPTPDTGISQQLLVEYKAVATVASKLCVERWTQDQVVQSYTGRLRVRYQAALDELKVGDTLTKHDKKLSAFLKAEKFNPLLKPSKPRMIMARGPKYNLLLATWLKPLEHALYRRLKGAAPGVPATRQVGKGLNGRQRANLIRAKMENVGGGCVVFEVDGKSFESHVSREDLRWEHNVYSKAFGGDPRLREMLDVQLSLKGKTACGIRYGRDGARASGDFNTGMGNTIIMRSCVIATLKLLYSEGAFRWDILVDGDNALIFVEQRASQRVHKRFAEVASQVSNQELAVENPETDFERVTFGQCKPCFNGECHIMVRDPTKQLSNSFSSYRHYNSWSHGVRVLKAVSQCELALARGIPILEAYYGAALQQLRNVPDLRDPTPFLEGRLIEAYAQIGGKSLREVNKRGVSAEARLSFARAWGIGEEQQCEMERKLVRELSFPQVWLLSLFPWNVFRFIMKRFPVPWRPIYVGDGPDGEVPQSYIVSYLGAK